MKLPTVTELVLALEPVKNEAKRIRAAAAKVNYEGYNPSQWHIPVHVQVHEGGGWVLHKGRERTCDDDHTGFWGSEYVGPNCDLRAVAASMLEELNDQAYIHGEEVR